MHPGKDTSSSFKVKNAKGITKAPQPAVHNLIPTYGTALGIGNPIIAKENVPS